MAIEYARLYPDTTQLQAKNGANLTDGYVLVFLAGTDDPAVTYSDFNGTRNPQRIVVDDNGRFTAIVDKSKAYRVEVYDANGMLLWTAEPVWCTGNSGAGISTTRVISTDGSISVDESVVGSQRTYDIGIAPSDSDEFLEWVKCVDEDVANGDIFPTYVEGTMETMGGQGLHVGKDRFYHGTVTIKVVPTGAGINYETLSANLKFGEDTVVRRNFDIDNSLQDSVVCEFSYDFKAPEDGYLYLNLENVGVFSQVDVEMQVHRIYSGINAVPDTCATKQWVQETFDYNLSGKIGYSALEYNPTGEISGISGSAIATTDPARVSAIASSYAESAVSSISAWSGYFSSISSKADQSALEQCCDEVHSALDEKLDKSASSQFQLSGDYAFNSSLSAYVEKSSYSAFSSEVTNNISSISSTVSGLTGQYIEQSASGMFAPSGNYVSASDMSAYVPFSGLEGDGTKITGISGSAIKGHEYTGIEPVVVDNTADTISVEHRTLAIDETMTGYVSGDSAVIGVNTAWLDLSSKMDASASSLFYPADNPSGFISGVDLTPYQLTADMSAYAHESSLSSKLDASASSEFYGTSNPSGFVDSSYAASAVSGKLDTTAFSTVSGDFLTSHQSLAGYATESYVDSAVSGKLDVTASSQFLTSLPDDLATTGDVASAVSGKLDSSASGEFYPMTGNPSSFLTAHQSLAGYATEQYVDSAVSSKLDASAYDSAQFQLTADMSAYQLSGDYAYNSSLSSKLDASASSDFYSTSNPSGFISGVDLTPYQTTAGMSAYQLTADMSGYQVSGDYAYNSSVSGKQDASAMTAYQEVSGMTAYQPVGDYQPSGDYIQESALGWVEV